MGSDLEGREMPRQSDGKCSQRCDTKQTAVSAGNVWSCGGAMGADTRSGNRQLQSPAQPSPAQPSFIILDILSWPRLVPLPPLSDNRPLQNKTPPAWGLHISYSCVPIH